MPPDQPAVMSAAIVKPGVDLRCSSGRHVLALRARGNMIETVCGCPLVAGRKAAA